MLPVDKIKGVALVISGASWIIFVYNFDKLMHRPTEFNTKAILGFILGMIAIVNGMRIYRRNAER